MKEFKDTTISTLRTKIIKNKTENKFKVSFINIYFQIYQLLF